MRRDGSPYEAINHSPEAAAITQYMADYFVNLARQSSHSYADPVEEDAALIYNYNPTKTSGDFVQTYFFSL